MDIKDRIGSPAYEAAMQDPAIAKAMAWIDAYGGESMLPMLPEHAQKARSALKGIERIFSATLANRNRSQEDKEKAQLKLKEILLKFYGDIYFEGQDENLVQTIRMLTIQRFGSDMLDHFDGLDKEEKLVVDWAARRCLDLASKLTGYRGEWPPQSVQAVCEELAMLAYLFADKNEVSGPRWAEMQEVAHLRNFLTRQITAKANFMNTQAATPSAPTPEQKAQYELMRTLNTSVSLVQKADMMELVKSFEYLMDSHSGRMSQLFGEARAEPMRKMREAEEARRDMEKQLQASQAELARLQALMGIGQDSDEDRFGGIGE